MRHVGEAVKGHTVMSRGAQLSKDKASQLHLIGIATWGIVDHRSDLIDSKVGVLCYCKTVNSSKITCNSVDLSSVEISEMFDCHIEKSKMNHLLIHKEDAGVKCKSKVQPYFFNRLEGKQVNSGLRSAFFFHSL